MSKKEARVEFAYRRALLSDDGNLILDDLKAQLHYGGTTYTPGDPYATAWKEGMRSALLYILGRIERPQKETD